MAIEQAIQRMVESGTYRELVEAIKGTVNGLSLSKQYTYCKHQAKTWEDKATAYRDVLIEVAQDTPGAYPVTIGAVTVEEVTGSQDITGYITKHYPEVMAEAKAHASHRDNYLRVRITG